MISFRAIENISPKPEFQVETQLIASSSGLALRMKDKAGIWHEILKITDEGLLHRHVLPSSMVDLGLQAHSITGRLRIATGG